MTTTTLDRTLDRAAPARPRLGPLTAEAVFVGRSLRHTLRNVEALLMAILLPVLLMVVFTWVFGGAIDPSGDYIGYVVPAIILTCAGFGASYTAIAVNVDMTTGIIDRFRTMPLRGLALLLGHITASVVKNLVATAVVFAVGLAMGFRPDATPLEWLGAIGIITLWILAITTVFAAIGLAAGSPDGASGYGFILLFLPYLSSGFVPVSTLPMWLQGVAEHQPITPIIDTIRGLLTGTEIGADWIVAIAWCVGFIAVALVWGSWLYRRKAGRR